MSKEPPKPAAAAKPATPKPEDPVHRELAALPRPRKHYHWYYSTREANADMHRAPQGEVVGRPRITGDGGSHHHG